MKIRTIIVKSFLALGLMQVSLNADASCLDGQCPNATKSVTVKTKDSYCKCDCKDTITGSVLATEYFDTQATCTATNGSACGPGKWSCGSFAPLGTIAEACAAAKDQAEKAMSTVFCDPKACKIPTTGGGSTPGNCDEVPASLSEDSSVKTPSANPTQCTSNWSRGCDCWAH